jgi:hypothetical protein
VHAQRLRETLTAQPPCPFLEVPNMVDGVAAAILSHVRYRADPAVTLLLLLLLLLLT